MMFVENCLNLVKSLRFEIFISALITSIICRLAYLLGLQPGFYSLVLFAIVFFLVGSFCPIILPAILDRTVFQRILFSTFSMENFLRSNIDAFIFVFYFLPAALFSYYSVKLGLSNIGLLFINLSIYVFILSSYARLKELFFNPEFNTSFDGFNQPDDICWSNLFGTMSVLSAQRFGRPLTNRLPNSVGSEKFPHIVSSYMVSKKNLSWWSRISSAEGQAATKKFLSIGIGSAAVVGISGTMEHLNNQSRVAEAYMGALGTAAASGSPQAIDAVAKRAPVGNIYIDGSRWGSATKPSIYSGPPKGGSGGMVSCPLEEPSSSFAEITQFLSHIF